MSLSFRRGVALACVAVSSAAGAADYYFTPQVDAGATYYTNRDMTPDGGTVSIYGKDDTQYRINVGGILGARTPRSVTELRPRLEFQDYLERGYLKRVNGYLDLNNTYTTQLSTWSLRGNVRREDRTQAEFPDAAYDDFDPDDPTITSAGRPLIIDQTSTQWQLRPSIRRDLSQRTGIGLDGLYQAQRMRSEDDANLNYGYDNLELRPFMYWQMGPRTGFEAGAYVARYETEDNVSTVKTQGLTVDWLRQWSPIYSGVFTLNVEQSDEDSPGPEAGKSTSVGGEISLRRQGQVSQFSMNLGRVMGPSIYGSRSNIDQLRVQFRRNLSPRLVSNFAVRALHERSQGDETSARDHDYVRGEVELRWAFTRTLWISGRYFYTWQEYKAATDSAQGHSAGIRFGYSGLPPRRR